MSDVFNKLGELLQDHWFWLLIGVALSVLLWLAIQIGRGGSVPAPLRWYAKRRALRRLTVNILGVALIIWFAKTFALWVQPALTPDMLFTPPVVGPQGVNVSMVEQRSLEHRVTYTGNVRPYEEIMVYSRIDGYVEKLKVYPGDRVKKGEVLVSLETSEIEPRIKHTLADMTFWKGELKRDHELFETGAIGHSQFDRSRQQYAVAKARYELIKTQRDYSTIRARIDGWISERHVYPGVYVKKGTPLLKIDQLDQVRIQCEVAEKDLQWIHPGTTVYLRFPQMDPGLIRKNFEDQVVEPDTNDITDSVPLLRSQVTAVFPAVDPKTRTGTVEIRLPNPSQILKTNTYAVAELVKQRVEQALVVPEAALTPIPELGIGVFVGPAFSEEGPAELRQVKIGLRAGREAQILDGVMPNEFVITLGNRILTDGQTVRVVHREGGLF